MLILKLQKKEKINIAINQLIYKLNCQFLESVGLWLLDKLTLVIIDYIAYWNYIIFKIGLSVIFELHLYKHKHEAAAAYFYVVAVILA